MGRPRKETDVVKTFRGSPVLTLEQIGHKLHASRSTVVRRLKEHGYYSSYNQSGEFLTIKEVADFDSEGLWIWKAARFSRHGNLKQTVQHFVQTSERGMTHEELATLLGVRVHNPLLKLVSERTIRREKLGPTFVYLSRSPSARKEQIRRREAFLTERAKPRPSSRQIIATLLEVIKDPSAKRHDVVLRCQRAGVSISRELVDLIFETHDLEKKTAPSPFIRS